MDETTQTTLRVFANDYEWFIAPDLEGLPAVLEGHYGPGQVDFDPDEWGEEDLDAPFTIHFEPADFPQAEGIPPEAEVIQPEGEAGLVKVKATFRAWVQAAGKPGFLASTEF